MPDQSDLRRFLLFSLIASLLILPTALQRHHATAASPTSSNGPAVYSIEIKRLSKADKSSRELAQLADHSKTTLQSAIKFTLGEPFISKFQLESPMVLETYLDEVDMPSQLLEDYVRTSTCVPYKSLKPLHLLPLEGVVMTRPQKIGLNFFSGVYDRFSVGNDWFLYSSGLPDQILQLVNRDAPFGASESALLKNFHIDGGISPSSFQRYCLNGQTIGGRAIKINVEISDHKITRRSPPYIEQAYFD